MSPPSARPTGGACSGWRPAPTSAVHTGGLPLVSLDDTRPAPGRDGGPRLRLGELLVRAGVLTRDQVEEAIHRRLPRERLGAVLLRIGVVSEDALADALATQLRLPRIDVTYVRPAEDVVALVPGRLAERHEVLPLGLDASGDLQLAMVDPSDLAAIDDVRLTAGVRAVRPVVATAAALRHARQRAYRGDVAQQLLHEAVTPDEPEEDDPELGGAEEAPVVQLVANLLTDAVTAGASDLHVEPDAEGARVRVRIDGLLREAARVPRSLSVRLVSRLKILASLDIAERRLPQDGRAVVRVDGRQVDLRVSTMPTLHGETVVLRILPAAAARVELDELGVDDGVRDALLDALGRPQGLVLVTGPTGSGKTTTLYAALSAVADPARNVLTLEDPVEYQLEGINQTQVDPRIGLTFARGLRHVLRQDPDVVLVGEIRDQETAQLAVEASATGHLVLATLHTNDAPSSVARLTDLGADRFLTAATLQLVVAQRLVRTVCTSCDVPTVPDPAVLRRLGLRAESLVDATPRRGAGCDACDRTGERGRTAVTEVLTVGPVLRELVGEGAPQAAIARAAREQGLVTLRERALELARAGRITFAEALRATPDAS
ncbi:type II/IV secretion system protein [Nitriliruptoraceae bacterium ZYF776]|nr:type II/IV secretion system protein [Profundirhabdus halotolerans]